MAPKKKPRNTCYATMNDREKKQVIEEYRRKSKKTREECIQEEWTRSCTSKKLPGDTINEIKNGPPGYCFSTARKYGIFLPRNTKWTQNFIQRKKKIDGGGNMIISPDTDN